MSAFAAEPFESPDVQALAEAQQAASRALYGGEADIGPVREGWMFEPPDGVFLVAREGGRAVGRRNGIDLDVDQAFLIRCRDGMWQEVTAVPLDSAFERFWA